MLEYYIKTIDPRSHIGVCEIISLMGIKILEDGFGGKDDEYYGIFKLMSDSEGFDVFVELPDITIDFPPSKVVR
jgi:hypothetical protein